MKVNQKLKLFPESKTISWNSLKSLREAAHGTKPITLF